MTTATDQRASDADHMPAGQPRGSGVKPSHSTSRPANELLCLVTIAVLIVVAAVAALAVTTRVVVLVGALALLFLALAAVIAEVLRLASDDEPATSRRQPPVRFPASSSAASPSTHAPTSLPADNARSCA